MVPLRMVKPFSTVVIVARRHGPRLFVSPGIVTLVQCSSRVVSQLTAVRPPSFRVMFSTYGVRATTQTRPPQRRRGLVWNALDQSSPGPSAGESHLTRMTRASAGAATPTARQASSTKRITDRHIAVLLLPGANTGRHRSGVCPYADMLPDMRREDKSSQDNHILREFRLQVNEKPTVPAKSRRS